MAKKKEILPSQYVGNFDVTYHKKRAMNELAAFVHACDVLSARLWHDRPLTEEEVFGPGRSQE